MVFSVSYAQDILPGRPRLIPGTQVTLSPKAVADAE